MARVVTAAGFLLPIHLFLEPSQLVKMLHPVPLAASTTKIVLLETTLLTGIRRGALREGTTREEEETTLEMALETSKTRTNLDHRTTRISTISTIFKTQANMR